MRAAFAELLKNGLDQQSKHFDERLEAQWKKQAI